MIIDPREQGWTVTTVHFSSEDNGREYPKTWEELYDWLESLIND